VIDTRAPSAMAAADTSGLDQAAVRELSCRKQEPAWLLALRLEAWEQFQRIPMPTQRDELWKRTSLAGLDLRPLAPYRPFGAGVVESPEQLPRELRGVARPRADVGGLLVQRDSTLAFRALAEPLARRGVLWTDLDSAVRLHPELVRARLGQLVPPGDGKFQALNAALWSGGTFVYVPRGVAVELPLQAVCSIGSPDLGLFPRTLAIIEEEAELVLVEEYLSTRGRLGQPLASVVVELFAAPASRVRYVGVQQWGAPVWHVGALRARAQRAATVTFLAAATGGRLTKQFVDVILEGDGSEAEILGLMFGDGHQHFDTYTLQEHLGSRTRSDLNIKVALRDRASSNFTGLVRVNPHATKTDANQENRNLLLSEHAKADSDPKLEILNSDIIRCSHGATVGPVEQEALFYLMSRGLPRDQAEHVLVEGFFDPVLRRVPVESVRKQLWQTVQRKLDA